MNSNNEIRAVIETDLLEWESTARSGVAKKVLSFQGDAETALIKLDANSQLSEMSCVNSVEVLVLQGTYINEYGVFEEGSYLRFPQEDEASVTSVEGCVFFRKSNGFDDDEQVVVQTKGASWYPGQGRLEVMPLHHQTALVKWPKDERFIPHKHWGGEEILVLSGMFMDEHGKYPKGSWLRSPHLSHHYPYVEEETIIFVKTGHL